MPAENLEQKIRRHGNPARMLRDAPVGVYAFPLAGEITNWRDEQRAWRTTAVLFDQSFHMTDVYFKGPDVRRLLSDVGVNGFKGFGAGRAKQFLACNEDGQVVGDAVLFGLAEDEVSLVGRPAAPHWLAFQAETGGYDVEVTRDERGGPGGGRQRRVFRFQLQGPQARRIIEKAHGGPIERIPFFRIGGFTVAGCRVRALNHTMTGEPGMEMTGLEMTGPVHRGPEVRAALLEAGREFGLVEGGARSYPTTAVESGWIPSPTPAIYTGDHMAAYRRHLSGESWEANASLGGSFTSDDITDYYQTPWDLGYGRLVRFDHDFIGRSALERIAEQPHRAKVWLRWNDEDVTRVMAGSLFDGEAERAKYLDLPLGVYATLQFDTVLLGERTVGLSTYCAYTANVGGWSSLAMVDEEQARDGAEVSVVWGEEGGGSAKPVVERHAQTRIRATISTTPLVR